MVRSYQYVEGREADQIRTFAAEKPTVITTIMAYTGILILRSHKKKACKDQ